MMVLDKTGLEGLFDFTLEWMSDQTAASDGPSIFTALQEQLASLTFQSGVQTDLSNRSSLRKTVGSAGDRRETSIRGLADAGFREKGTILWRYRLHSTESFARSAWSAALPSGSPAHFCRPPQWWQARLPIFRPYAIFVLRSPIAKSDGNVSKKLSARSPRSSRT